MNISSLPGEEWRPYRGSPSSYLISNTGRVWSIYHQRPLVPRQRNETPYYFLHKKPYSSMRLLRTHWKWDWIKYLDNGEECREIIGKPGYFITNRGRVWCMSLYRWLKHSQHPIIPYHYQTSVGATHLLVGRHFLSDYQEGLCICHREETLSYPEIHYVENLWVGTRSDNTQDMLSKQRGRYQN